MPYCRNPFMKFLTSALNPSGRVMKGACPHPGTSSSLACGIRFAM
jgi:hypothetical protein